MRHRGGAPTITMWERKISTITAHGRKSRITVQCGGQPWRTTGLRIAMAAGCTSLIGDGPGFRMMTGAGGPVRFTGTRIIARYGRRLMFRSSGSAVVSDSDSAMVGARSAGFPWDRVTFSIPGGAGGAGASALPTSPTSTYTTVAVLLRCTAARDFQT